MSNKKFTNVLIALCGPNVFVVCSPSNLVTQYGSTNGSILNQYGTDKNNVTALEFS